ncbi:AMP-binding protein [Streptomyces sp. TLI_146]|uniref:AMP-binding protein n=1 Tax=Streptomyces sp. TLI_146 TaxID=1938858 RepID=UPI000CB3E473|nr:AMP-binding protein [Streptomyces sp. TLI_146]PKV82823.1 long-chain acyl-CoA synthetase [Streptomyces sp. TLI_146]
MSNLATGLRDAAGQYPQRPAISLRGSVLTYADLDELSARAAGGMLARGVRAGDRVGLALLDVPAFAVLHFGALRIGAVVVTGDARSGHRNLRRHFGSVGPQLIFVASGAMPPQDHNAASMWVPAGPGILAEIALWPRHDDLTQRDDDPAVAYVRPGLADICTAAELTHGTMRGDAYVAAVALLGSTPEDTVVATLPVIHPAGQSCGLNATVLAGACLTLHPDAEAPRALSAREPLSEAALVAGKTHQLHSDVPPNVTRLTPRTPSAASRC